MAVEPVDLPQVGQVEQPVDVDHLVLLEVQRLDQQLAQVGVHARLHLEPDDLAEAALAQLVLDRPQQVVGLVGDREVGVAGDPEDVVCWRISIPGNRSAEVLRDHRLQRHEGVVADGQEARQHLLGHLHAREGLLLGHRVAQPDGQAQREVGDVGEGPPRPDGERRQHGEDLLAEDLRRPPRLRPRCSRWQSTMRMPCLREARAGSRARTARSGARTGPRAPRTVRSMVSRGGEAVRPGGRRSRRPPGRAARRPAPCRTRRGSPSRSRGTWPARAAAPARPRPAEDALVEVQPGELAVLVELGRLEVYRGLVGCGCFHCVIRILPVLQGRYVADR